MDDLALRVNLDGSDALAVTRELRSELKAVEAETALVSESARTMASELQATQSQLATFSASAVQQQNAAVSATANVTDAVSTSAVEAEASLGGVDAALQQTKATAEETGSWIAEHPLLAFSIFNAVRNAAGASSLFGAAASAAGSLATAAMTTVAASALATTVVVTGAVAAFVLLGQAIPTGRIDELADSLQVARNETHLLRDATTQLAAAQQQGISGDVFNASLQAEDKQRGRANELPTVDVGKASLAEAIGGAAGDGVSISEAIKLAGTIEYQIDVPTLEATAKEARRSVQTIAEDLSRVSASTSGAGWGQLSTLSAIANLSDASVKDLGLSVEELRMRAASNAAAFEALGINVLTAEGGLQSSAAVARQFADALDGMSEAERKAALDSLSLSETSQAVVNDLAKQATAISESRDAITAQNELTASQHAARISNQFSSLTTMAEAVGSRLKNWSDATIEAVSRPIMQAGADLTEWAAGGAASALQTLDGWLAAIESKVTGIDAEKLRLLDVTDGSDGAKATDEPQAAKLDLQSDPATRLDWLKQELAIQEKLYASQVAAAGDGKKPEKSAYFKQIEEDTKAAEKFRDTIYEVQRQIDDVGLNKADQRKNELMAGGADAATAGQTAAAEARLRTEQRLIDVIRERDRVAMSAAERAAAEVRDDGGSADRAAQIAAVVAETQAKATLLGIEKELAQLNMSDAEKAADNAKRASAPEGLQAEISAKTSRLAVEKELQQIEEQRRKLANAAAVEQQYGNEPEAVQREQLAARERMDRLRKNGADSAQLAQAQAETENNIALAAAAAERERAKQLTEQYADPNEKLRKDRDELDKLHADGLIGAEAHARGVAVIDEKLQKATGSAKELSNALNKGIDAYSTEAIDTVMRGIALNGLEPLTQSPAATPFTAVPAASPLAPPVPNALVVPQAVPANESDMQAKLAQAIELLAEVVSQTRRTADETEGTKDAIDKLVEQIEQV